MRLCRQPVRLAGEHMSHSLLRRPRGIPPRYAVQSASAVTSSAEPRHQLATVHIWWTSADALPVSSAARHHPRPRFPARYRVEGGCEKHFNGGASVVFVTWCYSFLSPRRTFTYGRFVAKLLRSLGLSTLPLITSRYRSP